MKKTTLYTIILTIAVYFISCEQTPILPDMAEDSTLDLQTDYDFNEIFGGDDYTQEDINLFLEEEAMILNHTDDNIPLEDRASCDDCSPYPHDISKFKDALSKCKYEYTNSSTRDADDYCSVGRFNTCRSWMVLTTSGSKDHRSELKLNNSVSFDDKNIMRAEMVIEDTNTSSSRGLTVGQIHNRHSSSERPLARIEFYNGNKIRVVVSKGNKKGDGSTYYSSVDYNQGQRLYYKLEIRGDGSKINWYIKNKSTGKSSSKTVTVNSDWRSSSVKSKYYFKAGAYQQVSGNKPRVSFNRFTFDLD